MDRMPHGQYYQNRYGAEAQYNQQYAQQYGEPQIFYYPQITEEQLPEKLRPLSPWAYIGYAFLMGIPVIGFIVMLYFSFSDGNVNRRNYARSILYGMIAAVIVALIFIMFAAILGVNLSSVTNYGNYV